MKGTNEMTQHTLDMTAAAGCVPAAAPKPAFKNWTYEDWKKNQKPSARSAVGYSLNLPKRAVLADPARLFEHLTQATCPHGNEDKYYRRMLGALDFTRDSHGNWYRQIGTSPVCFMAHLDTADACMSHIEPRHKGHWLETAGNTILGADDRAGVAILLTMAHRKKPGHYYLFVGEESGCIGSRKAAKKGFLPADIKQAVSFDRRGYEDVITHQRGMRCCSDAYGDALAAALMDQTNTKWARDSGGLYTDSDEFSSSIPEATNLSVGYFGAHSRQEKQNLDFLSKVAEAAYRIDWDNLPIQRDPTVHDSLYRQANGYGAYGDFRQWDRDDDGWGGDYGASYWGSQVSSAEARAEALTKKLLAVLQEGEVPSRSDLFSLVEQPNHRVVDCLEEILTELQLTR